MTEVKRMQHWRKDLAEVIMYRAYCKETKIISPPLFAMILDFHSKITLRPRETNAVSPPFCKCKDLVCEILSHNNNNNLTFIYAGSTAGEELGNPALVT